MGETGKPFQRPPINLDPGPDENEQLRTLPEVIEFNANNNPSHVFCLQARDAGYMSSLTPISNVQLKRAISQCGRFLRSNAELRLPMVVDGKARNGPPIAILMQSGVELFIHQMALIGMGVPVLLLSPRLSTDAIRSLLARTSTVSVIVSPFLWSAAREAAPNLPLHAAIQLNSLLYYGQAESESICHDSHYINDSDRNVLILHSSGTTGLPKPIYVSHRYLLSFLNCHQLESDTEAQGINVSTLPLYHGFGLLAPALSMSVGKTVCLPSGSRVPNVAAILSLLEKSHAASLMTVPSVLEDFALLDGQGIQALEKLDFVAFGGGTLNLAVGERLASRGVKLLNHYGTTESGPLAKIFIPSDDYDWRFFRLREDMHFKVKEEVVPVGVERRLKLITFPLSWEEPFEIQDQLVCNPNHPQSDFNALQRTDDVIVLASGEKVQPHILEVALSESAVIKTAIMFGEHQLEVGVLIQPVSCLTPDELNGFKREVWPLVVAANKKMDSHGRIQSREAILIVPSTVEIPRTDKGSVARRDVYKMFQKEISQLYLNPEVEPYQYLRLESLENDIRALMSSCIDLPPDWGNEDNFFLRGMGSIQANRVRRAMIVAVRSLPGVEPQCIGRDFVYSYSSIQMMADFFRREVSGAVKESATDRSLEWYVQSFTLEPVEMMENPPAVLLLTGATGSLGSHCLSSLTYSSAVEKVVCLIRRSDSSSDPLSRLRLSIAEKKVSLLPEQWAKIEAIECNTADESLGLPTAQYRALQQSVTHVLHAAWPMDFHLRHSSFQSQFQSLHNLLALSRDIHHNRPNVRPRLVFISSIATVGQYSLSHIVPEDPVVSVDWIRLIGYAKAKLVCERILEHAREDYSDEIEISYIRMGQIAGSSQTGFWNTTEHIPALIMSSQLIGCLPCFSGVSRLPCRKKMLMIQDLVLDSCRTNCRRYSRVASVGNTSSSSLPHRKPCSAIVA